MLSTNHSLPGHNYDAYPDTLTEVSSASIRHVMLHYARGTSTEPRHHIIASGLEMMLKVNSIREIGIRSVIERAGYGFSRFYKLWPSLDRFHFDVWHWGLECHSLSEREHLRQLGKPALDDFGRVLVEHMVYAQHLISPTIFKHIMMEYSEGDMMRMLEHTPAHARETHNTFVQMYPAHAALLPWDAVESFAWMMGTYLFSRLLSASHKLDDQATIDNLTAELMRFAPQLAKVP